MKKILPFIIAALLFLWSDKSDSQIIPNVGSPMIPNASSTGLSATLPLSGANGGTGITNTGLTITLGASIITTGVGVPTLAFPASSTTYTYPTSTATLARTDAGQTFSGIQIFGAAYQQPNGVNLEYGGCVWGGNIWQCGTTTNSGTARNMQLIAGGGVIMTIPAVGAVLVVPNFRSSNTTAFFLSSTTASSTAPSLVPNGSDATTGIGAQAAGNISMIVGGAEISRWVSTGLTIQSTTDASSVSTGAIQNPGGMSVNKRVWFNGITASSGLQTAVLCQSSGGEVIADSVACLASSRDLKEDFSFVLYSTARDVISRLEPISWKYKYEDGSIFPPSYYRRRIGFIAEDVAVIDSRLVEIDSLGKPRSIDYNGIVSLLTIRVIELGNENDNLRNRIENIETIERIKEK